MTATPTTTARRAVSIRTAAEMYDVSTDTIRAAIHSGDLDGKKAGTRWLIPLAALTRWFDSLPEA